MQAEKKTGGISVECAHIFPVIKKWLYSDKEIFIREIISNASDAATKLKRLCSLGEVRDIDESFAITVKLDSAAKTITVSDNGIGMTEDEVERYICQIALSGALEFIEKYEQESSDAGIIGHFGLGFYSAFMVCDSVELVTRSYTGAEAVRWVCDESGSYEMSAAEKDSRGTDVIMHVNSEGEEYLDSAALRAVIDKYCAFMPIPIFFDDGAECECSHGEDEECECEHSPAQINQTTPLWQKLPSECTEEEYREFYHKVFSDWREPLFWIHINADYPLNFKGILYFPRLSHEYDSLEGQVKLYYNQVFVADNIKEVVPEYMLMLRGVLDCPMLPLNVSRSYLQSNSYVKRVSAHIVKKVADKLCGMKNTDREAYEKLWGEIKMFSEYAALCDKKFFERVRDALLLPLTDGSHKTLSEYLEAAKEKHENKVYYATDKNAQAQYIKMLSEEGIECALLDKMIDNQFVTMLEHENAGVQFLRVDSALDALTDKAEEQSEENESLTALFREVSGDEKLTVTLKALRDAKTPCILTLDEQARRFDDMMKMYRAAGESLPEGMAPTATLTLNSACPTVVSLVDEQEEERRMLVARQMYTLALLSQRGLTGEELSRFLCDSYDILARI
ncbi:MAG: molecular chaperone HtpG [Clostridia bacterium]|nr:molecular chaperone HtpG [Clostridia bacterium]